MSSDMGILPYNNESEESFTYRICYSALGQWCLNVGGNLCGGEIGTTKHNQTIILNELLLRFFELFPFITERFVDTSIQQNSVSVFMRRVYEETGYLLTDQNNHNRLANFGRSIIIGSEALFFGIPSNNYTVEGLGIFAIPTSYKVTTKDFLIRDSLTCEEYFYAQFDPLDFYERDISINELEIFNPLTNRTPSQSWGKIIETDFTVARECKSGPYYKIMKSPDGYKFAAEHVEGQPDNLTAFEYRRLYFSIKSHYGNPLKTWVTQIDEKYSRIRVGGHLPNREYYFLLLLSWPERSAFDKVSFIIKTSLLNEALTVLENIGLKVEGGRKYE